MSRGPCCRTRPSQAARRTPAPPRLRPAAMFMPKHVATSSTKRAAHCIKQSTSEPPIMIEIPPERNPDEPGAVVPHAVVCEKASGNRRPYLYRHKAMRFILVIFFTIFPTLLTAQVRIDPPDDWIELETPLELPPEIKYLKKVASKDKSIQVTVVAMRSVETLSGANEHVSGQINGMKKGGFILNSVNEIEVNGFPARHVIGEVRSDQYEGMYLADTVIIFSDEAAISVSVMVDNAHGGRELGASVLDWISITGSPAILSDRAINPSTTYNIAERVGYYAVWVVIGLAVVGVIRRGSARRRSRRGEQD
jgi:hypothetical protein